MNNFQLFMYICKTCQGGSRGVKFFTRISRNFLEASFKHNKFSICLIQFQKKHPNPFSYIEGKTFVRAIKHVDTLFFLDDNL